MVFSFERPRTAGQNALALNFLSKLGALLFEFQNWNLPPLGNF